MPPQIVGRVIRSTEHTDIHPFKQSPDGEPVLTKESVAPVVYPACAARVERLRDTEIPLKFEMGPMVQRVAHGVLYGFSPLHELGIAVRTSGNEMLVHTVRPHGPPFIVVPSQPYLCNVIETAVLRYHTGIQMVVVIHYRLSAGKTLIQRDGITGFKQKILVYHNRFLSECDGYSFFSSMDLAIPSSRPRSSARPRSLPMPEYPGLVFFFRSSSI